MTTTQSTPEIVYQGIAASPGIAQGVVFVKPRGMAAPDVYEIAPAQVVAEQERFARALTETRRQLAALREKVEALAGGDPSEIFDAHILVLEDPAVLKRVNTEIARRLQNAEFVFYVVMETYAEALRRVGDAYLRERTSDLEDITQRVLQAFREEPEPQHQLPEEEHILMAYDLTPSDTAGMDRRNILGFVTEQGSINSHTAILARALGIPAVVGLNASILDITTLVQGIVDGYNGKLILNPSPVTRARYRILAEEKQRLRKELESRRD
ncbi:MAG: PEP-utilizing enzyme, partial [Akkermansiaceae bacterium]|nr:PEP-utilizing enzyme [Akkermansiaceae bacterium]